MIEHGLHPSPQPYHRASRALPHRHYWWRPLVTLVVSAVVFVVMNLQVMVPLFINEGDVLKIDTRDGKYLTRVTN